MRRLIKRDSKAGSFCLSCMALVCLGMGSLLQSVSPAFAAARPFVLEKTITIPDVPLGPYSDSLAVDVAGGRIFATPQAAKGVAVLDQKSGQLLKMLPVGNPHGIFYSEDMKRLFVTDGASGDIKVFNGEDYSLIKTIPLTVGADGLVYDPQTKVIYVNNGGEDAGMPHGLVSEVDTETMVKLADIPIATPDLEADAIDADKHVLYVEGESAIFVVDLRTRKTVNVWKMPTGHRNKAIALDGKNSRLYVATRDGRLDGSIIVLSTNSGQVIKTLPIGGWVDGLFIDQKRKRIYASAGVGHLDTYTIEPGDVYRLEPSVETDILAKTSLYSSELDRMYVSVPHLGDFGSAQIMVFKPVP